MHFRRKAVEVAAVVSAAKTDIERERDRDEREARSGCWRNEPAI